MCNPTRKPTDGTVLIRFGTYNICNSRKGGLEAALRGMSQANMDLGILRIAASNPPFWPLQML